MHGRKPGKSEWDIFKRNGLDSHDWLVQKSTSEFLQIVHKVTGEEKSIPVHGK